MRRVPVSHLEIHSIRYDLGTKVVHFGEIPWRDIVRFMISNPSHSRSATAVAAVERAMAELRRGGIVVLRGEDGAGGLVIAAESCSPRALQRLQGLAQNPPVLVTTRRRAESIGMDIPPHIAGAMGETNKPITIDLPEGVPVDVILRPHESDRTGRHVALRHLSRPVASHAPGIAQAAIELAKLSRLLPAVVLGPLTRDPGNKRRDWAREQDLVYVEAADVSASYEETASRTLQQVAQAHVPLEGAENARILAWRPSDGGKEHLAIVVGEIDPTEPVLIRLHSECFTGDLLGLAALRLRRAVAQRHRRDRQAGFRCPALPRAGRPRHRPRQQAARLRIAGRRVSTRSTPTNSSVSTPTSASTCPPPPCCRAWASSA
jgi:GTP cyclohydrolase II